MSCWGSPLPVIVTLVGYVVLAVMTVALLYAAYTALANWPSIAV